MKSGRGSPLSPPSWGFRTCPRGMRKIVGFKVCYNITKQGFKGVLQYNKVGFKVCYKCKRFRIRLRGMRKDSSTAKEGGEGKEGGGGPVRVERAR